MSIFTPARIVSLALIAVVVAGLGCLRFAPQGGAVSVPDGAHAGQLTLHPCDYATEQGSQKADCGTLVVRENRANPQSRLIALPVTRIRARAAKPAEPIFRLEGGPGRSNMEFPLASRYNDRHDVVLVGYRGVDGSSKLDCPEVDSARRNSGDLLSQRSLRASERALRSCAQRLQSDGIDLAGYSLPQRTDDFEAARRALGYERVDLLSESAGTRTAMIYSWRHPASIHRSVMLAVNPPGNFLWDPAATDRQLRRFSALCSKQRTCPGRSADLAASMRATAADLPKRWGFLPIKPGNVRLGSFFGLIDASAEGAPISAPMTLDSWRAAAKGDASGLWFMSLAAELIFPRAQVWGDSAAVARTDAAAAAEHFASIRNSGTLGDAGSEFLWAGGRLAQAWPSNPDEDDYRVVRTSHVQTLLIGGTVDGATPAENATRELLPHLPNGHQVVLSDFGHTTDFWQAQPKAGTHLVTTFLDSGRVDNSQYAHQAIDFTPKLTQTAIAKGLAVTMFGLAIVTVLALMLMARRVRRLGRLGRKTSVAMRSAGAVVLGLGGWLAGALIAMIAMPRVPIDNTLLVVLSIGTPIALATYLAWVDRAWSGTTKAAGFAAAVAGALLGAALGFAATEGLLAPLTAIAGAGAIANLALLVRDVAAETIGRRSATGATHGVAPVPASAAGGLAG